MKSADIVKDIGHFFGFKFAPWGAVNFVKYLGWIGAAWTVFNVIKDVFGSDDERQKMEAELRKAREHIQSGFDTAAETVYTQLIERTEKQIDALTAPVLKDADDKLAEFQSKKAACNRSVIRCKKFWAKSTRSWTKFSKRGRNFPCNEFALSTYKHQ